MCWANNTFCSYLVDVSLSVHHVQVDVWIKVANNQALLLMFRYCEKAPKIEIIYLVKVSKSRKQIMMSLIPKKRTKHTQDTILSVFRSFFGRIRDFIICFRDLLTFNIKQSGWFFHIFEAGSEYLNFTYLCFSLHKRRAKATYKKMNLEWKMFAV